MALRRAAARADLCPGGAVVAALAAERLDDVDEERCCRIGLDAAAHDDAGDPLPGRGLERERLDLGHTRARQLVDGVKAEIGAVAHQLELEADDVGLEHRLRRRQAMRPHQDTQPPHQIGLRARQDPGIGQEVGERAIVGVLQGMVAIGDHPVLVDPEPAALEIRRVVVVRDGRHDKVQRTGPELRLERVVDAAHDVQSNAWPKLAELADRLRDHPALPGRPGADADQARRAVAQCRDLRRRLGHAGPKCARMAKKALAEDREHDTVRAPVEQIDADLVLEPTHRLGQRRLAQPQLLRRTTHAAFAGHRREILDRPELQAPHLSNLVASDCRWLSLCFPLALARFCESLSISLSRHERWRTAGPGRMRCRNKRSGERQ